MSTAFASGKRSIAYCDRCGFQTDYKELRPLTINTRLTNIRVCDSCYDPDHPQYRIGRVKIYDPQALRNARPDQNVAESREYGWGWNPVLNTVLTPVVNPVTVET